MKSTRINAIIMDIVYMDILTGGNLSSIKVANMDLIYWAHNGYSIRGYIDRGKFVVNLGC